MTRIIWAELPGLLELSIQHSDYRPDNPNPASTAKSTGDKGHLKRALPFGQLESLEKVPAAVEIEHRTIFIQGDIQTLFDNKLSIRELAEILTATRLLPQKLSITDRVIGLAAGEEKQRQQEPRTHH